MVVKSLNWLLVSPAEIREIVVNRARRFVPKEHLASQVALDRVSGENVSEWDYRVAFGVLQEREGNILGDLLLSYSKEYNKLRAEFRKTHPISAKRIWDFYKMTNVAFRSATFSSMLTDLSDGDFSRFYMREQLICLGEAPFFKGWDNIELVSYDPNFLFGVGQYKFRDKIGQESESIWDFRQKDLPAFVYVKKD